MKLEYKVLCRVPSFNTGNENPFCHCKSNIELSSCNRKYFCTSLFHLWSFFRGAACSPDKDLSGLGFTLVFWYLVDLGLTLDCIMERKISGFASIKVLMFEALGMVIFCCVVVLKEPSWGTECQGAGNSSNSKERAVVSMIWSYFTTLDLADISTK